MNSGKLFIIGLIMPLIPLTRGFRLKAKLFRWAGAKLGKNVRIVSSVKIIGNGELIIGDNTWIGHETLILSSSKIEIGANCDIAPRVYIGTGTHLITPQKERIADITMSKDISIGNGCWLCVNSIILPGVSIGNKCVVAAGAVVKNSSDDYKMLAGVPAKEYKSLNKNNLPLPPFVV